MTDLLAQIRLAQRAACERAALTGASVQMASIAGGERGCGFGGAAWGGRRVMTFEQWLEDLDTAAKRRGYVGEKPCSACGEECWRPYFEDGSTPDEALTEDESYA